MIPLPPGFDPRAEVIFMLRLVAIDTTDGLFRFLVGADGVFVDIDGNRWYGSQLLQFGRDEFVVGDNAPSGALTMSFFQDPDAPELVEQVRALGLAYVKGRPIRFYTYYANTQAQLRAPEWAPTLTVTRIMTGVVTQVDGPQGRALRLNYETASVVQQNRRRQVYNREDHERLIGEADPSLTYIPTDTLEVDSIF